MLDDALCLDVSEEGLERLRHPDGGARWERLPIEGADAEGFARYNHAAAVVRGVGLEEAADEEVLLVVGGSDLNHEPVETAAGLVVRAPASG